MASALFPGTFDPFTLGHEEMVRRGLRVFDTIVICIGLNSQKAAMFSEADRKAMIAAVFAGEPRVRIETFSGLTIEFAKSLGVQAMLRGLRNGIDLEYEKPIAAINAGLSPQTETVFLIPS